MLGNQNSYKVVFLKHLHTNFAATSSKDIYLIKTMTLDFVPWVGLKLNDDKSFETEIKEINYNFDHHVFTCWVEADKTFYKLATKEQMEELVESYIENGWEIRKNLELKNV